MGGKRELKKIGGILKQIRKKKNLTLKELSVKCGFSVAYLSKLERNVSSPTLETLELLCQVLDISILEFISDAFQGKLHVKKDDREVIYNKEKKVEYELLTHGIKNMKAICVTIEPNTDYKKMSWGHITDELGIVLAGKGEIEVFTDESLKEKYVLEEGDSFYIKANTHHIFRCIGDEKFVCYWIFNSTTSTSPNSISH